MTKNNTSTPPTGADRPRLKIAIATYGHTVWGENTHLIDHVVTVGVSRGF